LTHDGHSKVDVNHQNQSGETAILRASRKGHTDTVEELLKHDGVDLNLRDKNGRTPFLLQSTMWRQRRLPRC
jgi:ankyrin repeat protein